jgi:hypothetical protein
MNKTVKVVELELIHTNGRKSFGHKAIVLDDLNGTRYLKSYNTIMCSVNKNNIVKRHDDTASLTTRTHIKSFLDTFVPSFEYKKFWDLKVVNRPNLAI